MEKTIINIKEAIPRLELYRFSEPVNWEIREGQYWAVIGPNGGGKTLLTDLLSGKLALKKGEIEPGNNERISSTVKSVAFRDIYSIVDTQNSYYQQRWNKGVELDVPPFVSDLVANTDRQWLDMLIDWFEISDLMNKKVDMLSSGGELRKFLIVKILLSKPKILVLDNPFIGLDFKSRQILSDLLARLKKLEGLQIVLVLSNPKDIQDVVTDILPVADKKIYPQISKDDFLENRLFIKELFKEDDKVAGISNLEPLVEKDIIPFQNAAILKDIHIKYGERTILKDLNWTVERGREMGIIRS